MKKLFRSTAPTFLLFALPIYAQQQLPANSVAVAVAPEQEQLSLDSDLIDPAAAVQPQVVPKNDRLFWILPNYLTVRKQKDGTVRTAFSKD